MYEPRYKLTNTFQSFNVKYKYQHPHNFSRLMFQIIEVESINV